MKLNFTGQIGGPFGWGKWGENMKREFIAAGVWCDDPSEADVLVTPINNNDFSPMRGWFKLSSAMIGVCFTEAPLDPVCAENAKNYSAIFCGSTWNQRQLAKMGIESKPLIQGVDPAIFHPAPLRSPDGQIRIFSGGKFEYRKGQDLVIAAFREFLKTHPDAHLVCSWWNPWPELFKASLEQMAREWRWRLPNEHFYQHWDRKQNSLLQEILVLNGVPASSFTLLPPLTHEALAAEMRNTDFGVFPNRCEGGTNLVLMEYLSCGRKAAANLMTGHADLYPANIVEITATEDGNGWAVQSIDSIVSAMENAHEFTGGVTKSWSWQTAARTVIDTARECLQKKA